MGLLQGLGNFSNRMSGLLFPGMEATGVDPKIAQAAKAQAMMQMGAGLLGGQNFGQAYGLGQQAGYEPIEQARRQQQLTAAAQDRQAQADYQKWQMGRAEKQDVLTAEEQQREIRRDNRRDMRDRFANEAEQQRWEKEFKANEAYRQEQMRNARQPQYAPESFSPFVQQDGTVRLIGNRGTIRDTELKGPVKNPGSLSVGPDGEIIFDPSKASEGERVSAGYLGRMRLAETELSKPEIANYVPSTPAFMSFASLLDDDTGVIGATVANSMLKDEDRAYLGNALDFVLAKMRKESGATIKGGEFRKEYINYFPMPGDSKELIEAKAAKRATAIKQLEITAGRAEGAAVGRSPRVQADGTPPIMTLRSGEVTEYENGQAWTLENGKPMRVR